MFACTYSLLCNGEVERRLPVRAPVVITVTSEGRTMSAILLRFSYLLTALFHFISHPSFSHCALKVGFGIAFCEFYYI